MVGLAASPISCIAIQWEDHLLKNYTSKMYPGTAFKHISLGFDTTRRDRKKIEAKAMRVICRSSCM